MVLFTLIPGNILTKCTLALFDHWDLCSVLISFINFIVMLGQPASIAQWIHLHLSSYVPRFESQAQHLRFFQFVIELWCQNNENKQKDAWIAPLKNFLVVLMWRGWLVIKERKSKYLNWIRTRVMIGKCKYFGLYSRCTK